MKQLILITLISIFSMSSSHCKSICSNNIFHCYDTPRLIHYNYDTLKYLTHDFNDSASLYVNQPLKKLLKKLEIKPYSYHQRGERTDSVYVISIAFSKDEVLTKIVEYDAPLKYYQLEIELQSPIPMNAFRTFCFQYGYLWNRQVRNYLYPMTIKKFKFYTP